MEFNFKQFFDESAESTATDSSAADVSSLLEEAIKSYNEKTEMTFEEALEKFNEAHGSKGKYVREEYMNDVENLAKKFFEAVVQVVGGKEKEYEAKERMHHAGALTHLASTIILQLIDVIAAGDPRAKQLLMGESFAKSRGIMELTELNKPTNIGNVPDHLTTTFAMINVAVLGIGNLVSYGEVLKVMKEGKELD